MKPRKLILESRLSPGDIIMLTAAVRDLHKSNPGRFLTDVRTTCMALWENNPYITRLADDDPDVERIACQYPLINQSNSAPYHFIHGYMQFLSEHLGAEVRPTAFKGDIHLSGQEKAWVSLVQEVTKEPKIPFWIIAAGGKLDFTIKWWDHHRYQEVVDHFKDRILFVRIGDKGHHHPKLRGVLNFRGKTDLRQMVRLMYHAEGVLCPVTMLMHLAAAVETKPGMPLNRACVVVAGGREPFQWEAYPHHQFLHTNGALRCCDNGGCWKSRTVALGDGDEKDHPNNLCVNVVEKRARKPGKGKARNGYTPYYLPRCMDKITSQDVIRRIELYLEDGDFHSMTQAQRLIAKNAISEWDRIYPDEEGAPMFIEARQTPEMPAAAQAPPTEPPAAAESAPEEKEQN